MHFSNFSLRIRFFRPRKKENVHSFIRNGPYKRLKQAIKDKKNSRALVLEVLAVV